MNTAADVVPQSRNATILFILLTVQVAVISISIAAASIAFGLSLILVAYWSITERTWLFTSTPLDYFFVAYVCVEILTTITALYPGQASLYTKRLLLISNVYLVILAFNSREKFINGLMVLFAVIAGLSIVEIIYYYAEHENRLFIFQHYMTTGGLKMIVCLLAIPFLLHRETPARFKRWVALFFVPPFLALILTNTRSAWVGFLGGFIVMSLLKNKYLFMVLVLFLAFFFLFAPANQVQRAKSIVDLTDPTNHSRLVMWTTGLKIFADHPLLGVGDSDLAEVYAQYKSPDDLEPGGHLHNNFVMLLVTIGIVGLAIVMTLMVKILMVEFGIWGRSKGDWLAGSIALGAFSAFLGFLLNGLFEWNFGDHEIMVLIWFTVGSAIACERTIIWKTV